jgi:hypothetical protein
MALRMMTMTPVALFARLTRHKTMAFKGNATAIERSIDIAVRSTAESDAKSLVVARKDAQYHSDPILTENMTNIPGPFTKIR